MNILDGKLVRDEILEELKEKVSLLDDEITLAIILVGADEASRIYVAEKIKKCREVGINAKLISYSESTEEEIIDVIKSLNDDESVHGILLQSPLPEGLDFMKCAKYIKGSKDVDGLGMENVYTNYLNEDTMLPCTVKGIIRMLDYYNIDVMGKDVTIIGRGLLVGKPLSIALTNLGATVTLCHSKTKNIKEKSLSADIIVSAVGKSNLVTSDMVSEGTTLIDVGITRVNGKICGDVDFENVKDKCEFISPVPGGVGPMTISMVLENTYNSYIKNTERGN